MTNEEAIAQLVLMYAQLFNKSAVSGQFKDAIAHVAIELGKKEASQA